MAPNQDTDAMDFGPRYDSSDAWETESEDGLGSSSLDGNDMYKDWDNLSFPQFQQLPRELRIRIWELFCPELGTATQTLEFTLQVDSLNPRYLSPRETLHMRHTTKNVRRVMAVHRESRAIVEQALPAALRFHWSSNPMREALVRFRPERDIVFIPDIERFHNLQSVQPRQTQFYHVIDFGDRVQNVVVLSTDVQQEDNRYVLFLESLTQLKKVYCVSCVTLANWKNTPGWSWFSSESCYQKRMYFGFETTTFFWPKPDREDEAENLPADALSGAQQLQEPAEKHGWKLLPMVGVRDTGPRSFETMPGYTVIWPRSRALHFGFAEVRAALEEPPELFEELPSDVDEEDEEEYWERRYEQEYLEELRQERRYEQEYLEELRQERVQERLREQRRRGRR